MKPIVDIALVPHPSACVTPLELLEDFADSMPAWCFLEDDSRFYMALRGGPACVLRTRRRGVSADLVFAAPSPEGSLRLRLIASDDARTTLDRDLRAELAHHFTASFRRYLAERHHLAELQIVEAETEAYAA